MGVANLKEDKGGSVTNAGATSSSQRANYHKHNKVEACIPEKTSHLLTPLSLQRKTKTSNKWRDERKEGGIVDNINYMRTKGKTCLDILVSTIR